MSVKIGAIKTFPDVKPDKEQALKVLEEASEVFAAWQMCNIAVNDDRIYETLRNHQKECMLDECADVIQAVCNLAASLGVYDLTPYMQACEQRNRERGRL